MSTLIATLLLVAGAQVAPAPAPVPRRDAPPPRTGTAVIRGRITERDTGLPVGRIDVRLFRVGWTQPYTIRTDENGRFEFSRLPAGQYQVSAEPPRNRATYLAGSFAEKRLDPAGPARPLTLADGEVREGVDIALSRLVVISGRVLDEYGDPLSDIRVQAEPLSRAQGIAISRSRETDDRGAFRLFGLAPGRYRLCAEVASNFDERSTDTFVRTCYPSTPIEEDSQAVTVTTGESPELEIRLVRSRVFTLSGTILDASGAPAARVSANLTRIHKSGASGRGLQLDGAGRFTMRGLAPGEYAVHAEIGLNKEDDRRERQVAYVAFTLASDIENLVLTLSAPTSVRGRVIFEDSAPPPPIGLKVRAVDAPTIYGRSVPQSNAAQVREDLTFDLTGLYGQQVLGVEGLPREWIVKAVRYRNENVTGVPTEFRASADPQELQIILTSRVARIVARVADDTGKPSRDARVMMFSADPRQWVERQWIAQPLVHSGNFQKDGSFRVGPVRPGEYFIAAVAPEDAFYTADRSRLEALAKVAERISLGENEERQIELRVVRTP